jgi:predicted amino acid dehydrogenase
MSGPALVHRVCDIWPELPAVLISGFTNPDELQGEEMRCILVRKPFTPAALAGAIEAAMRERMRVG